VQLTDTVLEQWMAADGWPCERLDATTWRSGFQAPGTDKFRFFVRLTNDWLYLTVIPYVAIPDDPALELVMFRRLLELNRDITLAKLAIDKRDVVLTVEMSTQDLTERQFKDGLDALAFYGTKHHAELAALARPASN
jgi:hypothetical protein